MKESTFLHESESMFLHGTAWLPDDEPRAVVLVVHGMAEHHYRYRRFAAFLCDHGIAVYAYDHRGHGASAGAPKSPEFQKNYGVLAERNGDEVVVLDLVDVATSIRKRHPALPYFVFSHSFGTFVVRDALTRGLANLRLAGAIFSATAFHPTLQDRFGIVLAQFMVKLKGAHGRSAMMDAQVFGAFNKMVTKGKPKTPFDWVTHDEGELLACAQDPYLGTPVSVSFYRDMLKILLRLRKKARLAVVPRDLPMLFLAGSEDPVGKFGSGPRRVAAEYTALGCAAVELTIFDGMRHEILNEIERDEVHEAILGWLDSRLERRR